MAFRHGRLAEVSVNGVALTTFCTNMNITFNAAAADTTTFASTWHSSLPGLIDGAFDISGDYDPTAGTGPSATLFALLGAAPFAVLLYPGGNITPQRRYSGNANITKYSEGIPVGDKVTFTASFVTSGVITASNL
jgi:hypothetical protein